MKTEEDEAFDDLARRQGMWGGGFTAKRQAAADKLVEDLAVYGTSWSKNGERIDPMSVYKEPVQEPRPEEPVGHMAGGVIPSKMTKSKAVTELYALFGAPHNADINLAGLNRVLDELVLSAQPAQEPVAWMSKENDCIFFDADKPNPMDYDFWTSLYTAPPQREWVGLTENTVLDMMPNTIPTEYDGQLMEFAKALEQALKEKNT
jgi:hypothetical protein